LPPLRSEHRKAVEIWPFIQNQCIFVGRQIVLNLAVVFPVLEAMGVEKGKQMGFIEKFLIMHDAAIEAAENKAKRKI
jgi:hypothetical protein